MVICEVDTRSSVKVNEVSLVVHGGFFGEQRIVTRGWELDYNRSSRSIGSAFGSDRAPMGIGYTSTDGKTET